MNRRRISAGIWRMPVVLALASVAGLLAALFTDGFGDAISWIALAMPVAVSLWCVARSRDG